MFKGFFDDRSWDFKDSHDVRIWKHLLHLEVCEWPDGNDVVVSDSTHVHKSKICQILCPYKVSHKVWEVGLLGSDNLLPRFKLYSSIANINFHLLIQIIHYCF